MAFAPKRGRQKRKGRTRPNALTKLIKTSVAKSKGSPVKKAASKSDAAAMKDRKAQEKALEKQTGRVRRR
jgi:hypothetical protein